MANEKKSTTTTNECDTISKPLFTGDYIHDTSVSEGEKIAEASQAIFNAIMKKRGKKKEKR